MQRDTKVNTESLNNS